MYVTVAAVRAILARDPTNPVGTAAELSDADIASAITSAEAEVDAALAVRYTTPFADPVPQLVADLTRDIAAYLADLLYRQGKDYETQQDPVLLRYQRAKDMLDKLAAGKRDLPSGPPVSEGAATMRAHNRYIGNLFGLDDFGLGVTSGRVRRPYC
ncbi:phage protein Gp36 family protein [Amycolatopsis taiwanensis]|uniref:phage protein Gp36 family protein n=1 Tax=Amycolatopsis taiwanensis TaxID=342230 RepID=UPI00048393BC|nr:phage protein Gp36 family protein [Amycolatopsis taiwanensis]